MNSITEAIILHRKCSQEGCKIFSDTKFEGEGKYDDAMKALGEKWLCPEHKPEEFPVWCDC